MNRTIQLLLSFLLLAAGVAAQSPAQLKTELRQKETAAKQDADKLYDAGKWAEGKSLAADAKRIFQAVLKLKPDHEGANTALGNVQVDGKWMSAKDAAAAAKKAMEAEAKAKGMVEVDGIYVDKEQVADAKKGIFFHDGDRVSKAEKLALLSGKVRHPVTGQFIPAKDLPKAEQGLFPIGTDGRWVDEKEADAFHAQIETARTFRTAYTTLASTLPLAKLQEAKLEADRAYEILKPLFGLAEPMPGDRPVVFIASTTDEYQQLGTAMGDATSSYGAFLSSDERRMVIRDVGEVRPALCIWEKDWGAYNVRHAVGMAYANSMFGGAELPLWLLEGFGALPNRFVNDGIAAHFARGHIQRGGVKDLKSWFSSFDINGEMEAQAIAYNIFQAGFLLWFARSGTNTKVTEAMQDITKMVAEGKTKGLEKAIEKLQSALIGAEEELKEALKKLAAKQ